MVRYHVVGVVEETPDGAYVSYSEANVAFKRLLTLMKDAMDQLSKNNQHFSNTGDGTEELFRGNGAMWCRMHEATRS
jgi:hypothetical protein